MDKTILSKYDTQSLWQKDHDHVIHPYTNFKTFDEEGSVIFAEGKDHFVYEALQITLILVYKVALFLTKLNTYDTKFLA